MGIYDRDYMKGDDDPVGWKPDYSIKRWLTIALIAVSILTSLVWFGITQSHRYEKRSLIVNINTATLQELETLPNIGPARAKLIVEHRPYKSVEDLEQLNGIGPGALEELRPLARTDGKTRKR